MYSFFRRLVEEAFEPAERTVGWLGKAGFQGSPGNRDCQLVAGVG